MRFLWPAVALAVAARSQNLTVEDSDPRIVYDSPSAWNLQPSNDNETFSGGSLRSTSVKGASVAFTFNGSYIAYVADTKTGRGIFNVSLDDSDPVTMSGSSATTRTGVKLFEKPVDPSLQHTIKVTNADIAEIAFDCFVYTPTTNDHLESNVKTGRPDPPLGLVLGGTIGGSALVLSCIVLALVLAPPDPPQVPFKPMLNASRAPSSRRSHSRSHRYPSPSPEPLMRPLGARTPSHLRSDSSGSLTHSYHTNSQQSSRSRDRTANPFASTSSLAVPYANPFASSSQLDLDSASGSSIPLQQQGRLPPGQGFICASCSVELARERTARMQQQDSSWAASSGSGSRAHHQHRLPPPSLPYQNASPGSSSLGR
ncbi:hypothetical protein EXIGLDRAFT_736261 [Exidia glandulosa HHB12029]|uniref:Uncharacterized protein n=1 Tax=Exidia glandulosa HHB12029 TaxID=1314781 RepID=A0A165JH94_EXIGL|nr:hypothetical protein EXIGLDRAFT_736261 [Exidia glandulosa HHB12029]